MKKLSVLSPLLLILLMLPACSFATALHFDEFGTSPLLNVNGMHVFGVTFQFSPGFADYNGQIGTSGSAVLVSDPLFTGPTTGRLRLHSIPHAAAAIRLGAVYPGYHLSSLHCHPFQWTSTQWLNHAAVARRALFGGHILLHERAGNRSDDHVL